MEKKNNISSEAAELRRKAEEQLKKTESLKSKRLFGADELRLIHELEVHQIELEMQNEELKLAQTNAEVATEKYFNLYNFSPTGYFTLSKEGNIIELNIQGAKMLGEDRSRLLNSRFGFFISEDTRPIFNLFLDNVFKSEAKESCEVTLPNNKLPMYVHLSGIVSENKEYCNLTLIDITEHQMTLEKLRQSEELFRKIFEDGALGIALAGLADGRIISANKALCEMLGYTEEELKLLTFVDVTHPDYSPLDIDVVRRMREGQIQKHYTEKQYLKKNGEVIWAVRTLSILLNADGEPIYALSIIENITERKQAELIIKQQNTQLHELNAEKDKLFSIIAHDLRSPFQSFLNLTKILAEESKSFSAEELSEIGSNMNQSANNLFTLLQNLFEWANMQKGSMNFQPEELSLSELISANVELVNQMSRQKGINLINMAKNHFNAYADKNMINSVLSNLLWNAIKFTNRNGAVAINAKKNDNEMIEISVKDTGVGIPKSVIDNLFKIGEKTGRQGTDGELSTGLGLLLCKEFINNNNGKLWVESEEGVGSTFSFTLRSRE